MNGFPMVGMNGYGLEEPGQTTNLNIFSSVLTVEQMRSQTSPGEKDVDLKGIPQLGEVFGGGAVDSSLKSKVGRLGRWSGGALQGKV